MSEDGQIMIVVKEIAPSMANFHILPGFLEGGLCMEFIFSELSK